jgi:hypothetical protein
MEFTGRIIRFCIKPAGIFYFNILNIYQSEFGIVVKRFGTRTGLYPVSNGFLNYFSESSSFFVSDGTPSLSHPLNE